MRNLILCSLIFLALQSAVHAAEPPTGAAALPAASIAPYHIVPEDILDVTVEDHADLSKMVTVLPDGTITYPYLGENSVAGLTLHELNMRITEALKKQIVNPEVMITLHTLHPRPAAQVSVLGAVKSPGKRVLKDGWHILDLLIDCGGLSVARPELASATLIRSGAETIPVDLAPILTGGKGKMNMALLPDDVLLVTELPPSLIQVQVMGEVVKPGPLSAPQDGSLLAVLNAAGGPTPKAALSKATLSHKGTTITLDLRSILTEGKVTSSAKIEPGDTLFIPQNRQWYGVFGAVGHSGQQEYSDIQPVTVLSALSAAGADKDANLKSTTLIHPSKDGKPSIIAVNVEAITKQGDMSKNLVLQPGDILYVPSRTHKLRGLGLADVITLIPYFSLFHVIQ